MALMIIETRKKEKEKEKETEKAKEKERAKKEQIPMKEMCIADAQ